MTSRRSNTLPYRPMYRASWCTTSSMRYTTGRSSIIALDKSPLMSSFPPISELRHQPSVTRKWPAPRIEQRAQAKVGVLKRLARSNAIVRLKSWEYWPFGIIQLPFFLYWLWLSFKARSLLFFSASNPRIPTGGMFGESKFEILRSIPPSVAAKSALMPASSTRADVLARIRELELTLPVIFKPDIGERGWMVRRICTEQDIDNYLSAIRTSFIIQELIDLPFEFGVFYRRYPNEPSGIVTSIVMKEMLTIYGDGHSTFEELIMANERARLQWHALKEKYRDRLNTVLRNGEVVELVSIGNHCLGTKFLDGSHLITDELCSSFDRISRQIPDFYFGRYDLRAASLRDLARGRVKILELNGCGAEPAHIYDPAFTLAK